MVNSVVECCKIWTRGHGVGCTRVVDLEGLVAYKQHSTWHTIVYTVASPRVKIAMTVNQVTGLVTGHCCFYNSYNSPDFTIDTIEFYNIDLHHRCKFIKAC